MPSEHLFLTIWTIGVLLTWPPWIWWSIHTRRASGYPLIPRAPRDALYSEGMASGREHGKLGGARKCLLVTITRGQFIVTPRFPFNLVAPRGILGLEHTLPRASVAAALHRGWGGTNVRVSIPSTNEEVVLDLKLRSPDAFLAALGS